WSRLPPPGPRGPHPRGRGRAGGGALGAAGHGGVWGGRRQRCNSLLGGFAAAEGVPVIYLAGLGRLAEAPLAVGGVPVPDFYAPDGFHPATVPQGLLGNAVLEAVAGAYDPRIARFRLTDQQVLEEAGIAHGPRPQLLRRPPLRPRPGPAQFRGPGGRPRPAGRRP